jgi:hypothetical protein
MGFFISDIQLKMVAYFITTYSNPIEIAKFLRFYNNEKWSVVEMVTHNTYGGVNNSIPTQNGECWL